MTQARLVFYCANDTFFVILLCIMNFIFVGLGNKGEEYEKTRHNTGRIILDFIKDQNDFSDWKIDKKLNALVSSGKISSKKVIFLCPETFMNNSGQSLKPLKISQKDASKVCVIYDDLDLPFGKAKISFNKSSGGHKGLESIIKILRTEKFPRFRIGISGQNKNGLKKPVGEEKVHKHIMGDFKDDEIKELKKISKIIGEAMSLMIKEGLEKSRTFFNSKF